MQIRSEGYIEKANKLADDEIEFVVSTDAIDSYKERIDVAGIMTKDYMKNPVVLWGHDGFSLPIATATKVWKDGNKLMARAKFFVDDAFPRKVHDYLVKGRLKAVSIGGMVEEWGDDGMTIKKMNMKEFSVVSVPANPEALMVARSWSSEDTSELNTLAKAYAVKQLAEGGESELKKDIEMLGKLVATLSELSLEAETHVEKATNRRVILKQIQVVDKQAEKIIIKLKGDN